MKAGALARLMAGVGAMAAAAMASAGATIAWFDLEGKLADRPEPLAFLQPEPKPTLLDVVHGVHRAAEDEGVKGLVVRLREPVMGMTQAEELGEAFKAARERGKRVILFTENYGPGEIVLGSFADEVVMQMGGVASFPGLHMEELFLADTLGWLGLKADFVQIGDYKGAKEQLGNSAPSPAWEENISGLLDSMYATMRGHVEQGRGMSPAELDEAMRVAWLADDSVAVQSGLVDRAMDRLELEGALAESFGEDYETDLSYVEARGGASMDMTNPFAMLKALSEPPDRTPKGNAIAIVHIDGVIVDGESEPPSPLSGGGSVGSLTIRKALAEIEYEENVRGVVVRIDSPGGSASASESIWQGLRRVAETKPVWVSVGGMAASGGYYIAVAGEKVYVNPSSIVGSIGVVGGKIVLGGAMEKLHMHVVSRSRGPSADMMSLQREWSAEERALVESTMRRTYEQFVDRVTQGRDGIDIGATAEGRLFTGARAVELKMADEVGGLDAAVTGLAERLGLEEYELIDYPAPKSLAEMLEEIAGSFGMAGARSGLSSPVLSAGAEAAKALVGERAWESVSESIRGALELRRERVLLISPRVLIAR
ncbi:MAG: signal peptide peptidase SppA [Phycisphaerales bacterium]